MVVVVVAMEAVDAVKVDMEGGGGGGGGQVPPRPLLAKAFGGGEAPPLPLLAKAFGGGANGGSSGDGKKSQILLNVGGPDRVSRLQMAEAVAIVRGYNKSLLKAVSASSVDRGVKSPADISMDITKLIQTLEFSPTKFQEGVRLTLANATEVGS